METIDFNTSRMNLKEKIWLHGKDDTRININALDKTQKQQAIEYLEGILEKTEAKLLDEVLPNERLEEYKLLTKTVNTFLVELSVPNI